MYNLLEWCDKYNVSSVYVSVVGSGVHYQQGWYTVCTANSHWFGVGALRLAFDGTKCIPWPILSHMIIVNVGTYLCCLDRDVLITRI